MKGARRTSQPAKRQANRTLRWRFVLGFWAVCGAVLVGRAVQLQVVEHDFLAHQGEIRNLRVEPVAAHRGVIRDREGRPLAVSTPVTTMATAAHRVTTTMGTMPAAARATAPTKMRLARLAWSKAGMSSADHSMSTTSRLSLSPWISSRCPWTSSSSPALRRISVSGSRIMWECRWIASTMQWVW